MAISHNYLSFWKTKQISRSRMEFPDFGMSFPVRGCTATTFFKKYDKLRSHWYNYHQQTVLMYKCSICMVTFRARKEAKKHDKSHKADSLIFSFNRVNDRYMSPGDAVLPHPKVSLKDDPTLSPREQAARRRHALAEICSTSGAAALSSRGHVNIPRDHEVTEKEDGTVVVRSKSLWASTPVTEEVLDYIDDVDEN